MIALTQPHNTDGATIISRLIFVAKNIFLIFVIMIIKKMRRLDLGKNILFNEKKVHLNFEQHQP